MVLFDIQPPVVHLPGVMQLYYTRALPLSRGSSQWVQNTVTEVNFQQQMLYVIYVAKIDQIVHFSWLQWQCIISMVIHIAIFLFQSSQTCMYSSTESKLATIELWESYLVTLATVAKVTQPK